MAAMVVDERLVWLVLMNDLDGMPGLTVDDIEIAC